MADEASERQVREEGLRGMTCEGCVHSIVKARLVQFRFCNKYKTPRNEKCLDYMGGKNGGKREG
jgi:hypothetical protein